MAMMLNNGFEWEVHRDIIQKSDEWFDLKTGRFSSTRISGIDVKGKNKFEIGGGLLTDLLTVVGELKTGLMEDGFRNANMQRGSKLEPEAVELYETLYFRVVEEIGFVSYGDYFGDSPDGWVDTINDGKGCLEVKCRKAALHMLYFYNEDNKYWRPKEYLQMMWHCFIGRRDWCELVSYHPDFDEDSQLFVRRFYFPLDLKKKWERKILLIHGAVKELLVKNTFSK